MGGMKAGWDHENLSEAVSVQEVKERMAHLRPDSERQWGRMNPAQAITHCTAGLELAPGDSVRRECSSGGFVARW